MYPLRHICPLNRIRTDPMTDTTGSITLDGSPEYFVVTSTCTTPGQDMVTRQEPLRSVPLCTLATFYDDLRGRHAPVVDTTKLTRAEISTLMQFLSKCNELVNPYTYLVLSPPVRCVKDRQSDQTHSNSHRVRL